MKTEVYSWRLSSELKEELEREARFRKISVSKALEMAARDWLKQSNGDSTGEDAQRNLHASAARYFGAFAGGNPHRAETARAEVRKRLQRRHGR